MATDRPRINVSALTAIALWGGVSVAGKLAMVDFDSFALIGFRFVLGVPLLFLLLPAPERRSLLRPIPQRWLLLLAALSTTVSQFGWAMGLQLIPASDSILLYAIAPILAASIAAAIGQDRLRRHVIAGLVVAFVGVGLVVAPGLGGGVMLLGDGLTLVGALGMALTSVLVTRAVRYYGVLACTAGMGLFGLFASLPFSALSASHTRWDTIGVGSWIGLGYTAILGFVVGQVLWYRGIGQLGSTQAMVYFYLQPIFGLALAAAVLGDRLVPVQLAGAAVVLVGVALAQGRFTRPDPRRCQASASGGSPR